MKNLMLCIFYAAFLDDQFGPFADELRICPHDPTTRGPYLTVYNMDGTWAQIEQPPAVPDINMPPCIREDIYMKEYRFGFGRRSADIGWFGVSQKKNVLAAHPSPVFVGAGQ